MKYIKKFNESTKRPLPTIEEVRAFITGRSDGVRFVGGIDDWIDGSVTINSNGTVDYDGSIIIEEENAQPYMAKLPFKFGYVSGVFRLYGFDGLTTLEGCPDNCELFTFRTDNSNLTNLVGGPKRVESGYDVEGLSIRSLEGAPEYVGSYFDCTNTLITSLEGSPREVGGFFCCDGCEITTLKGGPEIVGETLYLNKTHLTSLEGLPKRVESIFMLTEGLKIWDPRPLRDCECEFVRCDYEPIELLIELFNEKYQVILHTKKDSFGNLPTYREAGWQSIRYRNLSHSKKAEVYANFRESLDYNYVRGTADNPQVNLFRLREALQEFDLPIPTGNPIRVFEDKYTLVDDNGISVDFDGKRL